MRVLCQCMQGLQASAQRPGCMARDAQAMSRERGGGHDAPAPGVAPHHRASHLSLMGMLSMSLAVALRLSTRGTSPPGAPPGAPARRSAAGSAAAWAAPRVLAAAASRCCAAAYSSFSFTLSMILAHPSSSGMGSP